MLNVPKTNLASTSKLNASSTGGNGVPLTALQKRSQAL